MVFEDKIVLEGVEVSLGYSRSDQWKNIVEHKDRNFLNDVFVVVIHFVLCLSAS